MLFKITAQCAPFTMQISTWFGLRLDQNISLSQASVLLGEVDRSNRVRKAWLLANETTRPLIENEQLFRNIPFR